MFKIEYDGRTFSGWQTQPNGVSVQATIESALKTVVRRKCGIVGAGRTDAGVHARGQVAHVDLPDKTDINKLEISLNAVLPQYIAVREFKPVAPDFHARFSARERTYRYYITERKMPLMAGYVWNVKYRIDWKRVAKNVSACIGRHDFKAFCASNHGAKSTVCTVKTAEIRKKGEFRIFTIVADRYLYRMVRSIVGTLIDIGRGAITEPLAEILESGDRNNVGETAPPFGLVLENVSYVKADKNERKK